MPRRLVLRLLAALWTPPSQPVLASDPDRLLVIRPDHLGDLLFATPALRRLRHHFPKAHVACLVGPWGAPVLARNRHVDEVISCPFPWFDGERKGNPFAPYALLLQWARRLRRQRYAAALNLRFDFWWGAALSYLAGIPTRLGYAVPDCRPFLCPAVTYRPGNHEVVQNVLLADHLANSPLPPHGGPQPGPEFDVADEERDFARRYLARHGIGESRPFLVIHPGSRAPIKRWTPDKFARVGKALASRIGAPIVLTGSSGERAIARDIADGIGAGVVNTAGETTLGQLAAILERAALVIGVDSGPLHLAVALGRPTVHLYGPSDHVAFGPYGDPARHVVVRAGLECSPCHRFDWPAATFGDHPCLSAIGVEQVLLAAEQVLEGDKGAATR